MKQNVKNSQRLANAVYDLVEQSLKSQKLTNKAFYNGSYLY